MTLSDYLSTYLVEHDLRPAYVKHLRNSVKCLDAFTQSAPLEDVTTEHLNRWSEAMEVAQVGKATGRPLAKRTVKNKIASILVLLRAAIEDGSRGPLVGRVKKMRVRSEPVRAFSVEEIGRLLQAASEVPGWFERTGLRRCDWWVAVIHTAWDTALRVGDLLDLEWQDFRKVKGVIVLAKTQSKTGRPIVARVRDETWAAIQLTRDQGPPGRKQVFPWAGWRNKFSAAFRRVAVRAGINGTPKYLRRARATHECRLGGPAAAARILGHSDGTGALALKNYVDMTLMADVLSLPPSLPPIVNRAQAVGPLANGHTNGHHATKGASHACEPAADDTWASWV